jgi:hypothetical protein
LDRNQSAGQAPQLLSDCDDPHPSVLLWHDQDAVLIVTATPGQRKRRASLHRRLAPVWDVPFILVKTIPIHS